MLKLTRDYTEKAACVAAPSGIADNRFLSLGRSSRSS